MKCLRGLSSALLFFAAFFLMGFQLRYYVIIRGHTEFLSSKAYRQVQNNILGEQVAPEVVAEQPQKIDEDTVQVVPVEEADENQQLGLLLQHAWQPFIDKHKFRYTLNNNIKCFDQEKRMFDELTAAVIVESDPGHFARRNAMRNTWIHHAMEKRYRIRVMFLLGLPSDPDVNQKIEQESLLFHDIVQETFVDSYLNLTMKTIGALRWVTTFCPRAKYYMKLDDDLVLNIGNLTGFFEFGISPLGYLGGMVHENTPVMRDPRAKWYVPEAMFPMSKYPPYPDGRAYVMSMDVARRIAEISTEVEIFPREDIFIGLCAFRLNIELQEIVNFSWARKILSSDGKLIKTERSLKNLHYMYVVYDIGVSEMRQVWRAWALNHWD